MRAVLQPYLDNGQIFVDTQELCKIIDCSTPSLYKLRALGLAPKETRFPGTSLVRFSIEAIDEWMTELENPSKAKRIAIAEQKAKLKRASSIANANMKHLPRKPAKRKPEDGASVEEVEKRHAPPP